MTPTGLIVVGIAIGLIFLALAVASHLDRRDQP